jgi:hypothetical protein
VLFEKGISARKFHTTEIDVFSESVQEKLMNQLEEIVDQGHMKSA